MQTQLLVLEHEPRLRHASAVGMSLLVAGLPTLLVAGLPDVPTAARVVVGLCCTAIGAILGVRAERAVVICEPDGILIRGFVRSRRIPVRAVVGLRGIHLYWCSPRGRLRRSWLSSFATTHQAPRSVHDRNEAYLHELSRWLDRAVYGGLRRRAKQARHLDDDALARELRLATVAQRWERRLLRALDLSELTVWDALAASAAAETKRRALPR
ncbi:hypothetical protein [Kitasatospora griseola]|uniref:hypothetical protein n=1 Tax=Kitasatospora griseola TaxID=2064 RepID=UPI000696D70E|nr:hypothetical protein [Kitasatospora griseola]